MRVNDSPAGLENWAGGARNRKKLLGKTKKLDPPILNSWLLNFVININIGILNIYFVTDRILYNLNILLKVVCLFVYSLKIDQ